MKGGKKHIEKMYQRIKIKGRLFFSQENYVQVQRKVN